MFNIDKSLNKILNKKTISSKSKSKRMFNPIKIMPKMPKMPMMNMFRIPRLNMKRFGGKNDWDGDGVPNWKDCQPRNVMRQDFATMAGVPIVDYPESYGYKKKVVQMTPDEYMKRARMSHFASGLSQEEYEKQNVTGHREPYDNRQWQPGFKPAPKKEYLEYARAKEDRIDSIKAGLHLKEGVVPPVWLETKKGVYTGQEGRHRAVAAREMGYKTIPVHIVETQPEEQERVEMKLREAQRREELAKQRADESQKALEEEQRRQEEFDKQQPQESES